MAKRKAKAQLIRNHVITKSSKSKKMDKNSKRTAQRTAKKDLWTTLSGGKPFQERNIFSFLRPPPLSSRCFLDAAWGAHCCDAAAGSLNLQMAISLAVDSDKSHDSEYAAANKRFVSKTSENDLLKWKGLKEGRSRIAEIDIRQLASGALERQLSEGTAKVTDMLRASCYGIGICMPRVSPAISNSIDYRGKLPGTKFSTNVNPGSVCRTLRSKAEVKAAISEIETFARFGPFANHDIGMLMLEELLQDDETSWIEHKRPYKFKKDANCKPMMDTAKHHIDRLLQEPEHTAAVFVRSVSGNFKPKQNEDLDDDEEGDDDGYEKGDCSSRKEKQALEMNFGVKNFKCQRDMSGSNSLPVGQAELCVDYVLWVSNRDGSLVRYGISGLFSGDMGYC